MCTSQQLLQNAPDVTWLESFNLILHYVLLHLAYLQTARLAEPPQL